jgi:hypothetical protein
VKISEFRTLRRLFLGLDKISISTSGIISGKWLTLQLLSFPALLIPHPSQVSSEVFAKHDLILACMSRIEYHL